VFRPDAFSADRQRWGKSTLQLGKRCALKCYGLVDKTPALGTQLRLYSPGPLPRLRQFWEIPAYEPTANSRRWVMRPRDECLNCCSEQTAGAAVFLLKTSESSPPM